MHLPSAILRAFREACADVVEEPRMVSLRGNIRAKVLLIAPPCIPEEYSCGVPLSAKASFVFHQMLSEFNLDTDEHFLVVSCCVSGLKPKRSTCAPIVQFVRRSVELRYFKAYALIGSLAYQFIIGEGRKHNMATLAGRHVRVSWLKEFPVFVFPDIFPLWFEETGDYRTDNSAHYRLQRTVKFLKQTVFPNFISFYGSTTGHFPRKSAATS